MIRVRKTGTEIGGLGQTILLLIKGGRTEKSDRKK